MHMLEPVAQPTFLQQWGPLLAASMALLGALITLLVNARRDSKRYQLQREDDYRREQRQALASVMATAHVYRRNTSRLAAPDRWSNGGRAGFLALREQAHEGATDLLNALSIARLVVHGPALQDALDQLFVWLTESRARGDALADAYETGASQVVKDERSASLDAAWTDFSNAVGILQSLALDELRPTIVKG